jgi:hypothetical protein
MCRGAAGSENLPASVAGLVFRTKRTTAIEPANNGPRFKPKLPADQTQTTQEHSPANHPHWPGLVGSAPQAPRDLSHQRQSRRAATETGRPLSVTEASRLRSWLLARRSGRVSAWPCPPARSLAILSMTWLWNHFRCAHCSRRLREFPELPPNYPNQRMGRIRSLRGRVLSRTDCSACVIRDPGRSFF